MLISKLTTYYSWHHCPIMSVYSNNARTKDNNESHAFEPHPTCIDASEVWTITHTTADDWINEILSDVL